jgi:hypothetical protein
VEMFFGMFSQAETIELDQCTFGIRHSNVEIRLIVVVAETKTTLNIRSKSTNNRRPYFKKSPIVGLITMEQGFCEALQNGNGNLK